MARALLWAPEPSQGLHITKIYENIMALHPYFAALQDQKKWRSNVRHRLCNGNYFHKGGQRQWWKFNPAVLPLAMAGDFTLRSANAAVKQAPMPPALSP